MEGRIKSEIVMYYVSLSAYIAQMFRYMSDRRVARGNEQVVELSNFIFIQLLAMHPPALPWTSN